MFNLIIIIVLLSYTSIHLLRWLQHVSNSGTSAGLIACHITFYFDKKGLSAGWGLCRILYFITHLIFSVWDRSGLQAGQPSPCTLTLKPYHCNMHDPVVFCPSPKLFETWNEEFEQEAVLLQSPIATGSNEIHHAPNALWLDIYHFTPPTLQPSFNHTSIQHHLPHTPRPHTHEIRAQTH